MNIPLLSVINTKL